MRFDEYGAGGHPYLETPHIDALAASGATFRNAYHTTPLCSPNRACILTGQYASRHGIVDNTSRSYASHRLRTFARELQRAGYETAHVGKWHMGNDPTPRPGYDYWVSFAGQGDISDPELFENGRLQRVPGYITDLLTDRAIEFATRARRKPFMVYIGHKAIHPQIVQRDDGTVDVSTQPGLHPRCTAPRQVRGQELSAQVQLRPLRAGPCRQAGARRSAGSEALRRHRAAVRCRSPRRASLRCDDPVTRRDDARGRRGGRSIVCGAGREGAAREHAARIHERQRLVLRRARPERRAPLSVRRVHQVAAHHFAPCCHRAAARRCVRTLDRHRTDAAGGGAGARFRARCRGDRSCRLRSVAARAVATHSWWSTTATRIPSRG